MNLYAYGITERRLIESESGPSSPLFQNYAGVLQASSDEEALSLLKEIVSRPTARYANVDGEAVSWEVVRVTCPKLLVLETGSRELELCSYLSDHAGFEGMFESELE